MSGRLIAGVILGVVAIGAGIGFWQGSKPPVEEAPLPVSPCSARMPLAFDYPALADDKPFESWGMAERSSQPEATPFGQPPQMAFSWPDGEESNKAGPKFAAQGGMPDNTRHVCFRYRFYLSIVEDIPPRVALPGLYRGAPFGCEKGSMGEYVRLELQNGKARLTFHQPDGLGGCKVEHWPVDKEPALGDWVTVEQEWILPEDDKKPMHLRLWLDGTLRAEAATPMKMSREETIGGINWLAYPETEAEPVSAVRISQLSLWANPAPEAPKKAKKR
ncbi:hypothetical protein GC177_06610 [bacterium]|nr:hypothetical protein [bacterium]